MRLQPAEPAFGGGDTAALVDAWTGTYGQPRRSVDIPGRLRVPDRGLRLPVRLAPIGRTSEQTRHEIRLDSLELRTQQLLEEMVVAIPLPSPVQRHQEQVGTRQRFQHRRGAAPLEDRVAERTRHGLENGGPRQEAELVARQAREDLGDQIVGHKTVVPTERGQALHPGPARLCRERRQVQTSRPALRVLGELGDLAFRQLQAGRAQQLARLGLVHAQLVRTDLQREAPRAQRPEAQCGVPP